MLRKRRWAALLGTGFLCLALLGLLTNPSAGQIGKSGVPTPAPGYGGSAAGMSSVKILEDARFRQVINIGRDCIKDQEWMQAVNALQTILNEKADYYVQLHEQDATDLTKETSRWTSVKFAANNLLGSMPPAGLETYELAYGADAKIKLDEAKQSGDMEILKDVAQRFCHTKAGIEANEILATLFLARGQVFPAALRFEKLLQMNPEQTKLSDVTLFKAALAFRRAGDTKSYEDTWKRLQTTLLARQGLKIGDDLIPMARVEGVLNETAVIDIVNQSNWPMIRGNPSRTAQAVGSPPLLDKPEWRRPLFKDVLDGFKDEDNDQAAYDRVMSAIKRSSDANLAVLPGGFPIASQGIMVLRSPRDIRAIALKPIVIKDEDGGVINVKPGEILWKSIALNRSLAVLLDKAQTRTKLDPWLDSYQKVPGFDSFLYGNTTIGTLVTDHRNVYAINDMAVPPHPNMFQINFNQPNMNLMNPQEMKPLLYQSELYAYDLQTGKLKWDLNQEDKDFKDSHFLSLPISVGGKLYLLNEWFDANATVAADPFGRFGGNVPGGESIIRLVCIDPNKIVNAKPEIVGKPQVLGNILQHNRYVQDLPRRVNAVHLAYGEGILVCPTNAGEVFGIDLMTNSLVWSYPYRETAHKMIGPPIAVNNPNIGFRPGINQPTNQGTTTVVSKWVSAPPAIQDGKIVFTAPDADSIHCVNLRDGKPLWKRGQQKGDLYMAGVYSGRVLIVGENNVRILDIKNGSELRKIATNDLPSGQGVASKGVYYLPLKKGEILAIDIAKGEIKAHNRASTPGAAPGNLVFYEGMVLSQTATEVMAYPQLTAKLDIARTDSTNDPENLAKLTEYGDLLLKDGQVQTAVETLLKVYERKPADPLGKRVAERLFEALTDLMQTDFNKAGKGYLTVYEGLTNVPGDDTEQQARKAKYFRLVGQGREAQGSLVEAFQMYKEFGALPIHRDGGIASPEDPTQKIPINVWLRGRISGMIAKATPAERAPLDAKIAEEWQTVEAKKDESAIRSFVGMFDVPFRVGRDARVRLAETIMERNDRPSFLEAELYLYQVIGSDFRTEAETGGRALAALAHLEEKKGTVDSMRLAAAYYRQLARDFGDTPVRGAKTGVMLINELATDKRFLPFLEDTTNSWGPVRMASRDLPQSPYNLGIGGFVMQPDGDQTPFARNHRLTLNADAFNPRVRLVDVTTGETRWESGIDRIPMNQQVFSYLYQQANAEQSYFPNARFRFFHVKGHLIVCQVGVMIYCFDGDTGRELWKTQTVEELPVGTNLQSVETDAEGIPHFVFYNAQQSQFLKVALGRVGSVQSSHVAVLGYKGLTVHEPVRGAVMWKKSDVPINSHVFGDDQFLFLVEMNANGAFGAGRTLRASDGETLASPDFSGIYQTRVRVMGRQILATQADQKNFTLRLYDIVTGKDVWSKAFAPGSYVMQTEDHGITGVIELNGKVTVLDAQTGKELVTGSATQYRVTPQDLVGLKDVLLLQDSDQYYVALNRKVDNVKVYKGLIHNNFNNSIRCLPVNGWFLAFHKVDGQRKLGTRDVTWKKGDLAWHSQTPLLNQMLVMEQFEQLPILLFTARHMELMPNGAGNRWTSLTQSIQKTNGLWAYDASRNTNGSPWFGGLVVDQKTRTVNLIGVSPGAVQHYVDDGKGPPPIPLGALNTPVLPAGNAAIAMPNIPALPNGLLPPNGIRAGVRIMRAPLPIIELPALPVPPK